MPEIVNVDQAAAWNGPTGADWTHGEARYNQAVSEFYAHLVAAAAVQRDERVLDVGCGTGTSTRDAARAASGGSALGIDLSEQMLARARQRASEEGLANVRFEHADAQVHPLPKAEFDLLLSRYGVMFFADPVAAFDNLSAALRPGGRACFMVWQSPAVNPYFTAVPRVLAGTLGIEMPAPPPHAPGPFGLADPARVRDVLGAAGFVDVALTPVEARMRLGDDLEQAVAFSMTAGPAAAMLAAADQDARRRVVDAIREELAAHQGPDGITYPGATWIITAQV